MASIKGAFIAAYIKRLIISHNGKADRRFVNSVFAAAICLVPLVVVLGVANGMIEGIMSRFVEIDSYHLQITTYDFWSEEQWQDAKQKVLTDSRIKSAVLEWQGQGILTSDSMRKGVRIRAVETDYFEWPALKQYLTNTSGSYELTDSSSILLPDSLYKDFELKEGGTVRLLTAGNDLRGKNLTKISKLKCSGTYTTGYQELDRSFVLVDYDKGKKLSYGSTGIFLLGIRIEDPFSMQLEGVRADLQQEFAGLANVYTWKEINSVRIETFAMTKVILVIIMLLILMVAAVNISSNMIAMTSQRLPEIAILKSLGSGRNSIRDLFLVTGMICGTLGSFLGMATGLFIALNVNQIIHGLESFLNFFRQLFNFFFGGSGIPEIRIFYSSYYLEKIPVRFEARELVLIGIFTIFLSLVSSWFPASRAAKLKPMDVLRKH